MNIKKYYEQLEDLKQRCNVEISSEILGDNEKIFVLLQANLAKVMPDIPQKEHEQLAREIFFYKFLANLHIQYVELIQQTKLIGDLEFMKDIHTPRIYCTFHMGSYRQINLWLGLQDIDFILVLSKETLKSQQASYFQAREKLGKLCGPRKPLEFIEAENPTSTVSMVRALKNGKSLLFYIDGNTGVGGIGKTDEKMLPILFFSSTIYVRKGIAFLAHKCNVPIINLFSYLENNNTETLTLQFNPPIHPRLEADDIQLFCEIATQRIYNEFSEILSKYPSQWEGWMYIHRYMDLNTFKETESPSTDFSENDEFIYNQSRYNSFTHRRQTFLFDLVTYSTFQVEKDFALLLKNTANFKLKDRIIPRHIFEFLIEKKILIS